MMRARVVPGRLRGLLIRRVDNRQKKRGGLPAACLRARKQIAARESRRNSVGLYRRGTLKAEILDAAKKIGMKVELGKGHWSGA